MEFDLSKNSEQYDKEQDELLYTILDNRFFKNWKRDKIFNFNDERSLLPASNIELFITPTCNQKCEYCYLVKYDELYPFEINNKDKIFENLKSLLNWIKENDFYIPDIDLFSGEIWHTKFGWDFLDILYDFAKKNPGHIGKLVIPTNGSFLSKEETFFKMQNYKDNFNNVGINFIVSLSIDGKVIEDKMRPRNDTSVKDDDFYERAFLFAKHNGFSFHPMVAAKSVKYWIANYKWWQEECKKYGLNVRDIMMLEVRNDDWDEKSISDYNSFMNFLLEDLYKDCGENPEWTAKALFNFPASRFEKVVSLENSSYVPFGLPIGANYPGCTISTHLDIRLGDLAIIPCHRTSHKKNIYGFFELNEKHQIVGIKANNPYLAARILLGNNIVCSPKCDICLYNQACLKGCFGAQMEHNKDPFMPIPCVCDFFKAKLDNILNWYESHGIIDYLKEVASSENAQTPIGQKVIEFYELVKNGSK